MCEIERMEVDDGMRRNQKGSGLKKQMKEEIDEEQEEGEGDKKKGGSKKELK